MIKYECDMCWKQTDKPNEFTTVGTGDVKNLHVCNDFW